LVVIEPDHDRAVTVRPQNPSAGRRKPVQGRLRRMAVGIASPGGGDRDARSHGVHERLGRGRLAPMVGDLEQIDVGQTLHQQLGIDCLLDVAHQQEASAPHLAEQDDRHVVDTGSAVRRLDRHLAADGPQDPERDVVHVEPVACCEATAHRRAGSRQMGNPGCIPGPWPAHPGFEDLAYVVPIQQQRESRDMVLMRVGEDHGIDSTVPGRDVPVEHHEQPVGIRPAIDEQASAMRALDQDAVALADVEDRDPREGTRARCHHAAGDGDRDDQGDGRRALRGPAAVRSGAGRRPDRRRVPRSIGGAWRPTARPTAPPRQ
jgi:hypothetical protein